MKWVATHILKHGNRRWKVSVVGEYTTGFVCIPCPRTAKRTGIHIIYSIPKQNLRAIHAA